MVWVSLLSAAGCGRLKFELEPGRDATSGGNSDGDGSALVDSSNAFVDAPAGAMGWSAFSPGAGATDWYATCAFAPGNLWAGAAARRPLSPL